MSKPFKKIAVIGTHLHPKVAETVKELIGLLTKWKIDFMVETATAEQSGFHKASIKSIEDIAHLADLAIVVGGDGNLLRVARALNKSRTPIVGINRGQLGYLTDINPIELETLKPIFSGHYLLEKRFLLTAEIIRQHKKVYDYVALNDVVLFPGEVAQMIEFEIRINNHFVYTQRSDGLIISTPTGSTAYSLSAGGPILQPDMNAVVLTPMMPHTLTSRPIVVDADSRIDILISPANKKTPRLSYDGQQHANLELSDQISIRKARAPALLIHPENYDYYSVLRGKLNWGQQPIFERQEKN